MPSPQTTPARPRLYSVRYVEIQGYINYAEGGEQKQEKKDAADPDIYTLFVDFHVERNMLSRFSKSYLSQQRKQEEKTPISHHDIKTWKRKKKCNIHNGTTI